MKTSAKKYIFFAVFFVFSVTAYAEININIGVSIPGVTVTEQSEPSVIILPDTPDVYAVPDADVDIYFWNGFWWKITNGKWYKSQKYNSNWVIIGGAPSFYHSVNPHWRKNYSRGEWNGRPWKPEKVKHGNEGKGRGNDKYLNGGEHKKGKGHYKD